MRFVRPATLLALLAGCAAPQPRDAAWAQRKIDEAQCRAWAQSQARAEYGPQLRQAARQQEAMTSGGYYGPAAQAGVGLAGANIALLQLAQQVRENELIDACMIQRASQRGGITTTPIAPRQAPSVPEKVLPERVTPLRPKEPCASGQYWDSGSGRCEKF
jgi:hypothetical protein